MWELEADFQQYYQLDAMAMTEGGDAYQIWRASALVSQLPPGARLRVLDSPDEAWGTEAQLLRLIEYCLRAYVMAYAKDAPEQHPLPLPSEQKSMQEATLRAEQDMADVAAALGLEGGGRDAS